MAGKFILKVDGTKVSEDRGIDLRAGTNVTLTTGDTATDVPQVTIAATGGGSGGHTIKENGTPLTQRAGLNFGDGLTASDDAANDETDVSVDYGTAAELADVTKAAESAGTSAKVARADHKHDITTAAPPGGTEGTATTLARSDHTHGGTITVPIDLRNPRASSLQGNSFFTVGGLTAWDAGRWEFVKDVDGKIYGVVRVPKNLAASPNAKIVLSIGANATTGVTRLQVSTKAVADGESLNPASLTAETAQDVTVPATARLRKDVTFTLTEAVAADDLLIVEVFHEGSHANDTLAVNTELYHAALQVDLA